MAPTLRQASNSGRLHTRWWLKLTAAVVCATGLAVGAASSAGAVATQDLIFAPVAVHGVTPGRIVVQAGTHTTAAVQVTNRTAQELTVNLGEQSASPDGTGHYKFGAAGIGASGYIHLAQKQVKLGPHVSEPVKISVDVPRKLQGYAIVTAEAAPVNAGSVSVIERLAVLIQVQAPSSPPPLSGRNVKWDVAAAAGLALMLLVLLLLLAALRRRRDDDDEPPPAGGVAGADGASGENSRKVALPS